MKLTTWEPNCRPAMVYVATMFVVSFWVVSLGKFLFSLPSPFNDAEGVAVGKVEKARVGRQLTSCREYEYDNCSDGRQNERAS